jgi:peptidylprolyl isomerase domain and WD repeat-containing protein 1
MEDHNSKKRPHPDDDGDVGPQPQQQVDDDDDYGPSLPVEVGAPPAAKKRKTLAFQKLYLAMLPSAERYEKSYMHRDVVTHVAVSKTEFILTASVDGQVKFWKKQPVGVEFVKHIRAHLGMFYILTHSPNNY